MNAAYGYGSFLLGIIRGIDNHIPLVYSRIIVLVSRIHSDGKTGGCGSPLAVDKYLAFFLNNTPHTDLKQCGFQTVVGNKMRTASRAHGVGRMK